MPTFNYLSRSVGIALTMLVALATGSLNGAPPAMQSLAQSNSGDDTGEPTVIDVTGDNGEVIRSTDGGSTWIRVQRGEGEQRRLSLAHSVSLTGLSEALRLYSLYSMSSSVIIRYELHTSADVTVSIYGMNGSALYSSIQQGLSPGSYSIIVDAATFPKGAYYCRVLCGGVVAAAGKFVMN